MDDESKLTLHGLVQHYTMLSEDGKNKRLMDLLDQLDFNQVCGTPNNCLQDNCGAATLVHLMVQLARFVTEKFRLMLCGFVLRKWRFWWQLLWQSNNITVTHC